MNKLYLVSLNIRSSIIKIRFEEAKDNLQEKIKNMTGSGLGLKRKRKFDKVQSQSKRRKVKDIFTKNEKNRKRISNGVLKIRSRYLSQTQYTDIYRK